MAADSIPAAQELHATFIFPLLGQLTPPLAQGVKRLPMPSRHFPANITWCISSLTDPFPNSTQEGLNWSRHRGDYAQATLPLLVLRSRISIQRLCPRPPPLWVGTSEDSTAPPPSPVVLMVRSKQKLPGTGNKPRGAGPVAQGNGRAETAGWAGFLEFRGCVEVEVTG